LYDTLLEEFDDEVVRTPEEDEGFVVQAVTEIDIVEDDAELDVVDTATDVEVPAKLDEEELLTLGDDTESWSDDPVRMYLTQMGEIPLLTRAQEIYLAKKIELTRRRFRTKLLECDYVIQQAYKVLRRVHDGELPFDRTVQVSVTDRLEKDQIPSAALSPSPNAKRPGRGCRAAGGAACVWSRNSVCARSASNR
jgi:RNA polymerase primary sigma factor